LNCNQTCKKPNSNCLFRHLCNKPCGVNCGSCIRMIPIIMKCGHISEFCCSREPDTVECLECKVKSKQVLSCHVYLVLVITNEQFNEKISAINKLLTCMFYGILTRYH